MGFNEVLLTIFLLILFKYIIKHFQRPPKFPPGPPWLPVLGSAPFLPGSGTEKFVSDYIGSFGPVTGLIQGSYYIAMINDWKLAKYLFSKEEFSSRLRNYTTLWARSVDGKNLGLVFTDGQFYWNQKTFCVKHLKGFGFGKSSMMETVMVEQANLLADTLIKKNGGHIEINNKLFSGPIINVLWGIIAGSTFKPGDARAQSMLDDITIIFSSHILTVALMAPWVRFIFPSLTGYTHRLETLARVRQFILEEIDAHDRDLDENDPRDLMDQYLLEMRRTGNPEFSKLQLTMICLDMFGAGSDTSSSTLSWCVLYLTLYPEMQARCYQEITDHLAPDQPLMAEHSSMLHYCQAFIAECQRLGQVAVSTVMHRLTTQYTLPSGHVLPKDCIVMSNIKKHMMDPSYWKDPQTFNPLRFIDENGKFSKPDYFVPFGHGKRMCLGEPLAKAELFIFFVTLVRSVRFSPVIGEKPDPKNCKAAFTKSPNPFKVNISTRSCQI